MASKLTEEQAKKIANASDAQLLRLANDTSLTVRAAAQAELLRRAAPPESEAVPTSEQPAEEPVNYRTTTKGFIHRDGFICDVAVGSLVLAGEVERYRSLGFGLEPAVLGKSEDFIGNARVETYARR